MDKYVDEVRYGRGISYFEVTDQGRRVVTIGSNAFGRTKAEQLMEAAHELGHTQQLEAVRRRFGGDVIAAWNEYSSHGFGSMQYALDEVVAETIALRRISGYLGGVSAQQVAASTKYINGWRDVFKQGGMP